jgi:hypothetical protein
MPQCSRTIRVHSYFLFLHSISVCAVDPSSVMMGLSIFPANARQEKRVGDETLCLKPFGAIFSHICAKEGE